MIKDIDKKIRTERNRIADLERRILNKLEPLRAEINEKEKLAVRYALSLDSLKEEREKLDKMIQVRLKARGDLATSAAIVEDVEKKLNELEEQG